MRNTDVLDIAGRIERDLQAHFAFLMCLQSIDRILGLVALDDLRTAIFSPR